MFFSGYYFYKLKSSTNNHTFKGENLAVQCPGYSLLLFTGLLGSIPGPVYDKLLQVLQRICRILVKLLLSEVNNNLLHKLLL